LSIISGEYSGIGAWDKALALARAVPRGDFRSGALVKLAEEATRQKRAIDVESLIGEALTDARSDGYPVSCVNSLASIATLQSRLGDSRAAARTYDEALQIAQAAADRRDRAAALAAVAREQARSGKMRRALEIALAIDPEIERAQALLEISIAMAEP